MAEVIRRHQWPSVSIRSHHWQSDAISGHQSTCITYNRGTFNRGPAVALSRTRRAISNALSMHSARHSAWHSAGTQQRSACNQGHSGARTLYSAALSMHSACTQHAIKGTPVHVRFTQQCDHRTSGAQVRRRHPTDRSKEPVGRRGRRGEHLHAAAFPKASSRGTLAGHLGQGKARPGAIRSHQEQLRCNQESSGAAHLPR